MTISSAFSAPACFRASRIATRSLGAAKAGPVDELGDPQGWSKGDFVEKLWPWAMEAAKRLGLKPQALIAQAALETGWGQHLMRKTDGSPSNNLFGIKADKRWGGDRVSVDTLEFEQGVSVKKRAHFRSYDSFRQSFEDYVNFLQSSPRYRGALSATADTGRYFTALQEAGYATDPEYARKIEAVLVRLDTIPVTFSEPGSG